MVIMVPVITMVPSGLDIYESMWMDRWLSPNQSFYSLSLAGKGRMLPRQRWRQHWWRCRSFKKSMCMGCRSQVRSQQQDISCHLATVAHLRHIHHETAFKSHCVACQYQGLSLPLGKKEPLIEETRAKPWRDCSVQWKNHCVIQEVTLDAQWSEKSTDPSMNRLCPVLSIWSLELGK